MTLSGFLIVMAVVLLGTALYSINSRQKFDEEFSKDIKNLMDEANLIRKDLEAVLENAVLVSDSMIANLDNRLDQIENLDLPPQSKVVRKVSQAKSQIASPNMKMDELRRAHPYIAVPRLYNEGYSIAEIAEILEKGQGEIKLILDVNRKREVGS